jgi:hypothetical protein
MRQWQFDFKDWEDAFELFYRRRERDDSLVFVVSTDSYVSGYWVEPGEGAEDDEHTTVYRTVEEVRQLEQRVRKARAATINLSLGGVIT